MDVTLSPKWPFQAGILFLVSLLLAFSNVLVAQEKDTVAVVPVGSPEQTSGKWNLIPILYAQPEIGVGFGARVVRIFREKNSGQASRPSTVPFTLVYTTKRQTIVSVRPDLWFGDNKYHATGFFGYRNYPFKFYSIGNNTSVESEEFYTTKIGEVILTFEKRLKTGLYLGTRYEFRYEDIVQKEPYRVLAQNQIIGSDGQRSSGLGLTFIYDTRDNLYQPSKGVFHQGVATFFPVIFGSRNSFARYRADFRKYHSVFNTHILAFQAQFVFTTGSAPFQQLAQIGGSDVMRGFFQGRYRDNHLMVYQAEYRLPVILPFTDRFKVVGFGSMGQVANRVEDFDFSGFKYAAGAGLRYRFNSEGLNVRLDVGYGQKAFVYFEFNEAF